MDSLFNQIISTLSDCTPEKALDYVKNLNSTSLNIGITGKSGSGKSTLVNALRGLDNSDEGAAPTSATVKPTEYLHPNYPNIKIWDLPSIGKTRFEADKYLTKVGSEKLDFFIIVSKDQFSRNDAKLAQEFKKMNKKVFFVRSKADKIKVVKKWWRLFRRQKTPEQTRDKCITKLQKLGLESPKLFLVSSVDLHLFEFEAFWKTLEEELPQDQRDALLLALPNISLDVINKKKTVLEAQIKWFALASAAGAVVPVPVPGLSVSINIAIIVMFIRECQTSLGLVPESLLKHVRGVSLDDLKRVLKSPFSGVKVSAELVISVLAMSVGWKAAAETALKFIPFVGNTISIGRSGLSTYTVLNSLLSILSEDAQTVFERTHQPTIPPE